MFSSRNTFQLGLVVVTVMIQSGPIGAQPPSESEMAARIDALLQRRLDEEGVLAAEQASDSEFLRRAWLDLCGTLPPINSTDGISGVRNYLANSDDDKRQQLIAALLKRPTHATHFANLWRTVLLGDEEVTRRFARGAMLQRWLQGRFADNVPYDQWVAELLLAKGNVNSGPALYFITHKLSPEDLAASSSRVFLGTQIQCAQCHDHPMDHWTRKDFWGYAAFFAQLQRPPSPQAVIPVADIGEGEVRIPETDQVVSPKFLGGEQSPDAKPTTRRVRLAEWLTAKENPFFARAAVNRVWAILFGRGIVEPVDDLGAHNPPSHPELLDEIAQYFVDIDFDMDRLVRTLARTDAYARTSRTSSTDDHPELFARMQIKSLTADQLYDCLLEATRRRQSPSVAMAGATGRAYDASRQNFIAKFRAPTAGLTEYQAGIPQALSLMNGVEIRMATDLSRSDILVAINAPFFSNEERVETLFLSTVSRLPNDVERKQFVGHVESGGTDGDSRKALSDVLWALLNSAEFTLNH